MHGAPKMDLTVALLWILSIATIIPAVKIILNEKRKTMKLKNFSKGIQKVKNYLEIGCNVEEAFLKSSQSEGILSKISAKIAIGKPIEEALTETIDEEKTPEIKAMLSSILDNIRREDLPNIVEKVHAIIEDNLRVKSMIKSILTPLLNVAVVSLIAYIIMCYFTLSLAKPMTSLTGMIGASIVFSPMITTIFTMTTLSISVSLSMILSSVEENMVKAFIKYLSIFLLISSLGLTILQFVQ